MAYAWLVNPTLQTLKVLSLVSERWTLSATYDSDTQARAERFDAVEIELRALWV